MAKTQDIDTNLPEEESIPIVTIPKTFRKSYGNTFLIVAILIAEAIAAYTVVALNYSGMYQWVYGYSPGLGVMYEIPDITINPAQSGGQRYLVVSIGLQLRNEDDLIDLQRKEVIIKDAIISTLGKKTVPELAQIETRTELKQEIGILINQIMNKSAVRNLFFTQFVMQ